MSEPLITVRHDVTLKEEERQIILLALAHLAIERPGWSDAIEELAGKLDGAELRMYRELVNLARTNHPF